MLTLAEEFYLRAYGWTKEEEGRWTSPHHYPKKHIFIHQGHAVNSMKKYGDWDKHWSRGDTTDRLQDPEE